MRVSQEEKERSHARIVDGAARLTRARGLEATSVSDVMADAGLTHGGFYRHFDSKEDLVVAAIESAFAEILGDLEVQGTGGTSAEAVHSFVAHYLSDAHLTHAAEGCPIPALGADVARGPTSARKAFTAGIDRMIALLSNGLPGSRAERTVEAATIVVLMAGAVLVARACEPDTARQVMSAVRTGIRKRRSS
jgi:TetR/AcrR family transcriptional repressor of nem operon